MTRNSSQVNISPSIIGGPYSFSVVPDLPAGMSIGVSNGTIWGMPTDIQPPTNHTIFVDNRNGYDQVEINIHVNDIPPDIEYPSNSYTFVRNWPIEPIIPSHKDGNIEQINVSQPLPNGLELMTGGYLPIDIDSGYYHSCAIDGADELYCWGRNYYGELGIGSTTDQNTPQRVNLGAGRTATSVSLGIYYSCAILDDGTLKCWGQNTYGQLGINSTTDQNTPQTVNLGAGRTAVSVSAGGTHTCAFLMMEV